MFSLSSCGDIDLCDMTHVQINQGGPRVLRVQQQFLVFIHGDFAKLFQIFIVCIFTLPVFPVFMVGLAQMAQGGKRPRFFFKKE